jgi:hypothetical protein
MMSGARTMKYDAPSRACAARNSELLPRLKLRSDKMAAESVRAGISGL